MDTINPYSAPVGTTENDVYLHQPVNGSRRRMRFWRVDVLKAEMCIKPLDEREVLPYLLVYVTLSAVSSFPTDDFNLWDGVGEVSSVVLTFFGSIFIYFSNGGAAGRHFLQRYFAVGWVVAFRFIPVAILAACVMYYVIDEFGMWVEETTWHDVMLMSAVQSLMYWRTGYHIGHLAKMSDAMAKV